MEQFASSTPSVKSHSDARVGTYYDRMIYAVLAIFSGEVYFALQSCVVSGFGYVR